MADTITISNPDVVRDIETLAKRTGRDPVEAVADAVRAKLGSPRAPTPEEIAERRRKVDAILAEIDALPHDGAPLTDADLYDKDGMPL
ncbi:MAG: type II toxin-antitoxin system VapB family antitoxin [Hyphomonadaceae bacterium]|nr:type II toxin-antitoxin system VapB family antitoxin [Hyphomonadaceae bacterium]